MIELVDHCLFFTPSARAKTEIKAELIELQSHFHTECKRKRPTRNVMTCRILSFQVYLFLANLVFVVGLTSHALAESSTIEQRFTSFDRIQSSMRDSSTKDVVVSISKNYDMRFLSEQTPRKLRLISNKDLELLFRAARLVTFYTYGSLGVRDMGLDLYELQRRGLATATNYYDMYTTFVSARMFRAARILAARHPSPEMDFLPRFRDESRGVKGGPTELVLSSNMHDLVRRPVNMNKPAQMIVVSSPWCHFCQRAARDIEGDPTLRQLVEHHARWLVVPDGSMPFNAVHRWNAQHPHELMTLAYNIQEWPKFDHWDTPTFYFFKKSTLVSKLVGWPREGRKAELRKALRHIGLF